MKLKPKKLKTASNEVKNTTIDKAYELISKQSNLYIKDNVADNVAGLVSWLIMSRIRAQIHDNLINQFRSLK